MKKLAAAIALAVLVSWSPSLVAQVGQPAVAVPEGQPGAFPQVPRLAPAQALASVQWAGPAVTLDQLGDKSALLLVYATWCPKCNAWSGDFFTQLREAVQKKPMVVLAVNADDSPGGAQRYLTERGFFAPNVFHGYDPLITQRLGFTSNLYQYVLIGPDGAEKARGSAGAFFDQPGGRKFALPADLAKREDLGSFDFIGPEMSDEVRMLFWPWELGQGSETALRSAQRKLAPEPKEQVEAAINGYLDAQIERIRGSYKGSVPERLEAHAAAAALSRIFKTTPQSKKAKQVVAYMEGDEQFRRELAAKKVYDGVMQRPVTQRARLLRGAAKRFTGTHYGALAEQALASAGRP
jgi:hypothetical protein